MREAEQPYFGQILGLDLALFPAMSLHWWCTYYFGCSFNMVCHKNITLANSIHFPTYNKPNRIKNSNR